jgi:hypothetical protein
MPLKIYTGMMGSRESAVASRQSRVGSRESAVGECGMMGSGPLGVGSRQSAVGSRQSAVGSRQSSVGECGIIDLDFIIPMQPETILRDIYSRKVRTAHPTNRGFA